VASAKVWVDAVNSVRNETQQAAEELSGVECSLSTLESKVDKKLQKLSGCTEALRRELADCIDDRCRWLEGLQRRGGGGGLHRLTRNKTSLIGS